MTGTGALVRLILRRDRIRLPIWILSIVGIVYASAGSVSRAYSTPDQIQAYASTMGSSPAVISMSGPPVALDTLGGILVYETSLTALVAVALMAIFLVVRHTRSEEEEGRTELLRSAVVGLYAPAAAALLVVGSACVLVGLGVTAGLLSVDVPVTGSMVYGAAVAGYGLVFACIAVVFAQVMTHARGAVGGSVALVGVAFLLRAVGDIRDGTLSWFSPMGWSQQVRAFDDDRWWPLGISLVFGVAVLMAAAVLAGRRDLGSGIIAARPGPAEASPMLAGPVGLAFRLQRASIIGWVTGVFIGGAAYGSVSREVQSMVESNPTLAEYFARAGGATLIDAFFSTAILMLSLIGAGFAVSSALRLRSEEASGRLEQLLATGLPRSRWMLGSLLVTLAGSTLVVMAGGVGVGLAHGLVTGDLGVVPEMLGYALVYLPAVLVVGSSAVLLMGWLRRLAAAAWAVLAVCFLVGVLGGLLEFPTWFENLSPFTHTPAVPVDDIAVAPLAGLTLSVVLAIALGVVGFRRRDIG